MAQPKIFKLDLEVRFRDVDAMGHVNNAVYFTYFENGRVGFFNPDEGPNRVPEFGFILAHVSCDFIRPVMMGDRISLEMWVKQIGKKSFTFHYQIVGRNDGASVFATGESAQVCFDYTQNRSIPVSGSLKSFLSQYLILS